MRLVLGRCALSIAVALGSVAPAYASGADYAFDKIGVMPDQVVADMQSCTDRASKIRTANTPVVASTLAGGLIAGVAIGVMEGVRRAHEVAAAADTCMLGLGYSRLPLTAEEVESLHAAHGAAAKQAWIRAFVAKDQSGRIADAVAKAPKVLPQLAEEPYAVGGVKIDPASIKASASPVKEGDVLLTATASHRATAVLNDDVEANKALFHVHLAKGTLLYAVDPSGMSSPVQTTLWCGSSTNHVFGGDHAGAACLLSSEGGGQVLLAPGGQWMVLPDSLPASVRPIDITSGKLDLTVEAGDRIGSMNVTLKVVAIDGEQTRLRAFVERDGARMMFWTGVLDFNGSGRAELPFWSKRLVLTRIWDNSRSRYFVDATLSEDGSGAGWLHAVRTVAVR